MTDPFSPPSPPFLHLFPQGGEARRSLPIPHPPPLPRGCGGWGGGADAPARGASKGEELPTPPPGRDLRKERAAKGKNGPFPFAALQSPTAAPTQPNPEREPRLCLSASSTSRKHVKRRGASQLRTFAPFSPAAPATTAASPGPHVRDGRHEVGAAAQRLLRSVVRVMSDITMSVRPAPGGRWEVLRGAELLLWPTSTGRRGGSQTAFPGSLMPYRGYRDMADQALGQR